MDELIGAALRALEASAKAQREQADAGSPNAQAAAVLREVRTRPRPPVQRVETVRPAPKPPAATPASRQHAHLDPPEVRAGSSLQGLFEDGNSLLRAVVASEVLSPPLALRENAHWQKR